MGVGSRAYRYYRAGDLPVEDKLHGAVVNNDGVKTIHSTSTKGFLSFGPYAEDYDEIMPLDVYFSVSIDDATHNKDEHILSFEVYDIVHNAKLSDPETIHVKRGQFLKSNEFTLFKLRFTPKVGSKVEFRIFYNGGATISADWIVVVDPTKIPDIHNHKELLEIINIVGPPIIGDEILYIPSFTPDIIQQKGGKNYGGTYQNGKYQPTNKGGIEFEVSIDTSRKYSIEFKIDGGLANWDRGEEDGGRVVVVGFVSTDETYWFMLQRMNAEEFGGGKFRGYLAIPDWHYASNLIPDYSMKNWGTEAHRIKIVFEQNCYTYSIDTFQAQMAGGDPVQVPKGIKKIRLFVGNDIDRLNNFHAVTWFEWFKIAYE